MFGKKKTPDQARRESATAAQQGKPAPDNRNQPHQVQNAGQSAYNQNKK